MTQQSPDQSRLIFAFAHDLRSYLRTITTRIQLVQLSRDVALPEQESLLLEEAAASAADMGRLLSSIVAWYDVVPVSETTPLRLLLRGVLMETKPLLQEAGAEVTVENDLDVTVSKSFQTVLKELLSNACRFRRKDVAPAIRIGTHLREPGTVEIVVSDNGLGVEEAWREKIFQPLQRLQPRTEYPGFGMGLAMCRKIVEANQGSIEAVASELGGLSVRVTVRTHDQA